MVSHTSAGKTHYKNRRLSRGTLVSLLALVTIVYSVLPSAASFANARTCGEWASRPIDLSPADALAEAESVGEKHPPTHDQLKANYRAHLRRSEGLPAYLAGNLQEIYAGRMSGCGTAQAAHATTVARQANYYAHLARALNVRSGQQDARPPVRRSGR